MYLIEIQRANCEPLTYIPMTKAWEFTVNLRVNVRWAGWNLVIACLNLGYVKHKQNDLKLNFYQRNLTHLRDCRLKIFKNVLSCRPCVPEPDVQILTCHSNVMNGGDVVTSQHIFLYFKFPGTYIPNTFFFTFTGIQVTKNWILARTGGQVTLLHI